MFKNRITRAAVSSEKKKIFIDIRYNKKIYN